MGFLFNQSNFLLDNDQQIPDQVVRKLIGYGPKYPPRFSDITGGLDETDISSGTEEINSNVHFLLTTKRGEYFGHPAYGSNLPYLLFEPYSPSLIPRIKLETTDAISKWIPQIKLLEVIVAQDALDDKTIIVRGLYSIRNTPFKGSFVFPFQLGSGALS